MINVDYVTKGNMKENNPNWPTILLFCTCSEILQKLPRTEWDF